MSLPASPRRAYRSADDALVAGVAAGLAAHLGVPVRWVRLGFVVANLFSLLGVLTYAGLWMVLPVEHDEADAPGLEAATRGGLRGRRTRWRDQGVTIAIALMSVGLLVLLGNVLGARQLVWPLAMVGLGVAVLWWQADEAQRERWRDGTGRVSPLRAVVGAGTTASWVRLGVGLLLLIGGLLAVALRSGDWGSGLGLGVGTLVGLAGLVVVLGPLLFRLTADLSDERTERIRNQERADVAAHLHDSVLQTLALIQKSASDPAAVTWLARAQERDLRGWLFERPRAEATLADALRTEAAGVEDAYGVPIEVVCVGDGPVLEALLQAVREAMVNASQHSGAPRIDVYAEISPTRTEVFVRDRGKGFDPEALPADRQGVRSSILDRMQRHGGRAVVRSQPGEGTEVQLVVEGS